MNIVNSTGQSKNKVMERAPSAVASISDVSLPYFTEPDPDLARNSGGRDPLGFQPIWSAFGRKLVPNIASPVQQVNGIKAVLLIHWLTDTAAVQAHLTTPVAERGFFRLMEGLIEYWLYSHARQICFGIQSLAAGDDRFEIAVDTGKTVANGLYQYYRGTCRRAGLLDDDWRVTPALAAEFAQAWDSAAINALAAVVVPCLAGAALVPATVLSTKDVLGTCLATVFDSAGIETMLRPALFGGGMYRDLARDYASLLEQQEPLLFGELLARLTYTPLADELEYMRRCEPFLLVMQDTFDLVRAVPGQTVQSLTAKLVRHIDAMRTRAAQFSTLAQLMPLGRMKQMHELSAALAPQSGPSETACLASFVHGLVMHHARCMVERGRDPMVVIEGNTIVMPAAGERDPASAHKRLDDGYPWMNDYYLGTAAKLYTQLHGAIA